MDNTYYIDVNLGNECNYRCTYCFESIDEKRTGSITDDVIDGLFNFVSSLLEKTSNSVHIGFWGGEPLLHFDKMKRILEKFYTNPRVEFFLYTNGFYLERYIDQLEKYKESLFIQISYDFEPINSLRRIDTRGISHSDITRNAIKFVDDKGFKYSIKSTITWNDVQDHLANVYKDFYEFSSTLKNKNFNLAITPDNYNIINGIIDISKLGTQMKKLVKYMLKNNIKNTRFNWFSDYNCRSVCHSVEVGCLIDIDGTMYPCHGCSYMPENKKPNYAFGNVKEKTVYDSFMKFISRDISLESDKCKNCETVVCFRCNAINSTKYTYDLNSWNAPNSEIICNLYKEISKYVWVYRKMIL